MSLTASLRDLLGLGGDAPDRLETDGAWSDREIRSSDQDGFGFAQYAEVLARGIREGDTPLTFGVFGRWGSGKSSLMRLIEGQLEKTAGPAEQKRHLETLWINVWQLTGQEQVWHAFLQAIFSDVHDKLPIWKRIDKRKLAGQLVTNSWRIFLVAMPVVVGTYYSIENAEWKDVLYQLGTPFAKNPFAGTGSLLTYLLALWSLVRPGLGAARKAVKFDLESVLKYGPYEAKVTELRRLQSRFKEMVETLVGEDGRVVVFIDDLDRCTPGSAPEILEAIKVFASTERCVYVLGLDYEVVLGGVVSRYGFDHDQAAKYMEKIIQIPFHLPPLDKYRIASFVREYYPDLKRESPSAAEVLAEGLESNPREVKRALNVYRTWLRLAERRAETWEMDDVDPELLAKMVVIQARFRALHDHLVVDPSFLKRLEMETPEQPGPENLTKVLKENAPQLKLSPIELLALSGLLKAGTQRFAHEDDDQVRSYIFLSGTATGTEEESRTPRKQREVLLGYDEDRRKQMARNILAKATDRTAVREKFRNRLIRVIDAPDMPDEELRAKATGFTLNERLSANQALDAFEGCGSLEPETVRVPGGWVWLSPQDRASSPWWRWRSRREDARIKIYLRSFRIGRYPVTNKQYAGFVEAMQREGTDMPQSPSVERYVLDYGPYAAPAFSRSVEVEDRGETALGIRTTDGQEMGTVTLAGPSEGDAPNALFHLDVSDHGTDYRVARTFYGERSANVATPAGQEEPDGELVQMGAMKLVTTRRLVVRVRVPGNWGAPFPYLRDPPPEVELLVWSRDELEREINEVFAPRDWSRLPQGDGRNPVVNVTWADAVRYCLWLSETQRSYRLPTEAEWEKAAHGPESTAGVYPWGNEWNKVWANTNESGHNSTIVVDWHDAAASKYGAADMVGNVWEWCAGVYGKYRDPHGSFLFWEDFRFRTGLSTRRQDGAPRSARGGSYYEDHRSSRCDSRTGYNDKSNTLGFRIAVSYDWTPPANDTY